MVVKWRQTRDEGLHGSEYDSGKGKSKIIVSRAFGLADGLASEERVPKKGTFGRVTEK